MKPIHFLALWALIFTILPHTSHAREVYAKPVEISEFIAHADEPYYDAIELHNTSKKKIDLDGWYLSDKKNLKKDRAYRIKNVKLDKDEYISFRVTRKEIDEFALKAAGDEITLFDDKGKIIDRIKFGTTAHNTSYGRYTNSLGEVEVVAFKNITMDARKGKDYEDEKNSKPLVGPIVITEIMMNPDNKDLEFIEFKNIGDDDYKFSRSNKGTEWMIEELDYDFPYKYKLKPGRKLVLARAKNDKSSTIKDIREKYDIPEKVDVLVFTKGHIKKSITLLAAERFKPGPKINYYYVIDKVDFSDKSEWPDDAFDGYSLERKSNSKYGNDPKNWQASDDQGGTPGR